MSALHRHQLVWLTPAAWRAQCALAWDAPARACLEHWAAHALPLVVPRQRNDAPDDALALALSAPARWQRRKLALRARLQDIARCAEFPAAGEVTGLLPPPARPAWTALCTLWAQAGVAAHVYGSYGWQCISGLDHVHAQSDIDVWIAVRDAQQADALALPLQQVSGDALRVDGEFVFADGSAVAWREWQRWRAGLVRTLLVKSLRACTLAPPFAWPGTRQASALCSPRAARVPEAL